MGENRGIEELREESQREEREIEKGQRVGLPKRWLTLHPTHVQ